MPSSADYKHIDGLRGIGALCVYNCHFLQLLIEHLHTKEGIDQHWFWVIILRTPLRIFFYGTFWVLVFFLISGFVLPMRYFETKGVNQANLCLKMIKRYFRLMIPLFGIITLYWVQVRTNLCKWDYYSLE